MVCRESRLSSAFITLARGATKLEDRQVISLNHALMQESSGSPTPTQEQWNNFIDSTIEAYQRGALRVNVRSQNPVTRLNEARRQTPSAERYYASTRLIARAVASENGHREYLENYARLFGIGYDDARLEFEIYEVEMTSDSANKPSATFVKAWESDPNHVNLLVDQRALYVYEQMENNLRASRPELYPALATIIPDITPAQYRRAVVRQEVDHNSYIAEVGYDPMNGRLEIVFRDNPERIYAYSMSQEQHDEIFTDYGQSLGSNFSRFVARNSSFKYETEEEGELAAFHYRCSVCGQYSSALHFCPAIGSNEGINRDVRLAMNAILSGTGQETIPDPLGELLSARKMIYPGESYNNTPVTLRIASASQMKKSARNSHLSMIRTPVSAKVDGHIIEGQISILYEGNGRGYYVSPVNSPGDSERDNLRCTCENYFSLGGCSHLNVVSESVMTLIQGHDRFTDLQVMSASILTAATLEVSYKQSISAKERAQARWRPVTTSFAENPELFQTIYDEVKTAKEAFEGLGTKADPTQYPIQYIKENAFGGLGKRGDRGFGTEIEFDFPDSMSQAERRLSRRTIGDSLFLAGLTPSPDQKTHGHAKIVGYKNHHARGWAFEQDNTVEGGEIISPIMYDEPETWKNLEKVCNTLKDNGAIVSARSGTHVHVGAGDYNHIVSNHNNLLQSYSENEDLLFRLSTNPGSAQHRGKNNYTPNDVPSSPYVSLPRLMADHADHNKALNLEHLDNKTKDHIEFRTFDASLNPAIIQTQIGLSLYMTEGALRGASEVYSLANHSSPIGSGKALNPSRGRLSGEKWKESTRGIRTFIDWFVPGTEDGREEANPRIRQLISLFAMTKWQVAE